MSCNKSESRLTAKEFLVNCLLGLQHTFAMMGGSVIVPLLTGYEPSMALIASGVGTIIFHFCVQRKIPVFLGSSFTFIAAINNIRQYGAERGWSHQETMGSQMVGILATGLMYFIFAIITYYAGPQKIQKLFPPVVVGPIILVIGMILAPTVINSNIVQHYDGPNATMKSYEAWIVALSTTLIMVVVSIFGTGIWKSLPVIFGMVGGYLVAACFGIIDYQKIVDAHWIIFEPEAFMKAFGYYKYIRFDWNSVISMAPLSIVTFMEHIGDITSTGAVVGKDFFASPGLHRSSIGDAFALFSAALLGGPPVTTYSENTGVLAITRNYNPTLMVYAAVFAIILGIISKFGGILASVPGPVLGGAAMLLFGMISSMGLKVLIDNKVDLTSTKNMIVTSMIMIIGLGFNGGGVKVDIGSVNINALAICTITGMILNFVLPENFSFCNCRKKGQEEELPKDSEEASDCEDPEDLEVEPIILDSSSSTTNDALELPEEQSTEKL